MCELEGLFCDSVVGEEFRTGSTEGTMAWFYSVVFSTYLYGDIGGGAFLSVFTETRWFERVFSLSFQLNFNKFTSNGCYAVLLRGKTDGFQCTSTLNFLC